MRCQNATVATESLSGVPGTTLTSGTVGDRGIVLERASSNPVCLVLSQSNPAGSISSQEGFDDLQHQQRPLHGEAAAGRRLFRIPDDSCDHFLRHRTTADGRISPSSIERVARGSGSTGCPLSHCFSDVDRRQDAELDGDARHRASAR